jgi:NitT/TauT family transport system ATP-binding protein
MCDRVLVLSSGTGRIAAEIAVPLPHPRNRLDLDFRNIVDEIYAIPTSRALPSISAQGQIHIGLAQVLPRVSVNQLSGVIETLAAPPDAGHAELAPLADRISSRSTTCFRLPKHCTRWNSPSWVMGTSS